MQQRNVRLQYSTVVTLLAGVFGGCGGCLIGQLDERTVALPSRRRTIQTPLLSSTRMATGDFSITPALVIRGTIHNLCWFLPQMDRVGPHSARPPSSISVRDAGRIARTEQEHQPLR